MSVLPSALLSATRVPPMVGGPPWSAPFPVFPDSMFLAVAADVSAHRWSLRAVSVAGFVDRDSFFAQLNATCDFPQPVTNLDGLHDALKDLPELWGQPQCALALRGFDVFCAHVPDFIAPLGEVFVATQEWFLESGRGVFDGVVTAVTPATTSEVAS